MTQDAGDLVEVQILNFPLAVFGRSQEHAEGLVREFELIVQERAEPRGS